MKIIFVIACFSIFVSNSFADNVKLKFSSKSFRFFENDGLKIKQTQTKIRCHFINNRQRNSIIRSRYPFTSISLENNQKIIKIRKSSLTEYMPRFDLKNCAFILIVFGETSQGQSVVGDIVIYGETKKRMSDEALDFMRNEDLINQYLDESLNEIVFSVKKIGMSLKIIRVAI